MHGYMIVTGSAQVHAFSEIREYHFPLLRQQRVYTGPLAFPS